MTNQNTLSCVAEPGARIVVRMDCWKGAVSHVAASLLVGARQVPVAFGS